MGKKYLIDTNILIYVSKKAIPVINVSLRGEPKARRGNLSISELSC